MKLSRMVTVMTAPCGDEVTLFPNDPDLSIQPRCTGDEFYASQVNAREMFALLYVALQDQPITNEEIDWAREKLGITD